ncbi:MAG: tetratricopeptide repeat protein [Proteobacteria bacterium]|nr:tetratricopeptide repeat protein [Pseudomonadota bacterium]
MKRHIKRSIIYFIFTILLAHVAFAAPNPGEPAPLFSLKGVNAKVFDLKKMETQPMVVLYFFDADSRPSLDGLVMLDGLAKKYKNANLNVWGITLSKQASIDIFIKNNKPVFPILMDDASRASDLYDAKMILPTVCIIGPELKIIDYMQGGGKSTEIMLSRLAERKLMQKETAIAAAISQSVEKMDPDNYDNKAIKGYAALKEGNIEDATTIFSSLSKGKGRVIGLEGLAAVYTETGNTKKALELINEVEKIAPDRSYVNVLKGNILYSQNKKEEATAQFQKATTKKEGATYQKSVALNQLGRVYANRAEYEKARKLYDQAIELDPYYVEATSNKGVTYEKEGKWDSALDIYKKAQMLNKSDVIASVLAKKAEEMLTFQKDMENRKRVDALVKDLAERFRKQKKEKSKNDDEWTSRPLILTFVDLQEKGGLAEADGYAMVILSKLSELLNSSGRVQVVERMVMNRLLEELNIGSSELSDQDTALKIGNVLAAKLIGTGSLLQMPKGALLNMRLIDTETTALAKVITEEIAARTPLEKDLNRLNRDILKSVIDLYPIKGFVVQADESRIMINVGEKQGVVLGTTFNALEEKPPVEYKGKLLKSAPLEIAEIKVVQVEPDFSYAEVVNKKRALKQDDKVQEKRMVN